MLAKAMDHPIILLVLCSYNKIINETCRGLVCLTKVERMKSQLQKNTSVIYYHPQQWVMVILHNTNMYLSLNIFQYFPLSFNKIEWFLCHWTRKVEGYKCSLILMSKRATRKRQEVYWMIVYFKVFEKKSSWPLFSSILISFSF